MSDRTEREEHATHGERGERNERGETEVVREYTPIDEGHVHGVTFDGERVWFARDGEIVAFDPRTEKVARRVPVEKASGGTAFDGTHIYQLTKDEILVVEPETGRIVRRLPAPGPGDDSGMAWSDGYLWIGQFRQSQIHKVDAKTGEIVRTLTSDRFVTGVSCVDGELWHAVSYDGKPSELRHLGPDGAVIESLDVPAAAISGIERTPDGFWCGGEKGTLRLVRRKGANRAGA